MSGTDPDNKRQKRIDATRAFSPGSEPTPQHPPLPQNAPKIPGITLQYEIARGGMGVVYSGRQDFLDRRVAVKLLSVELGGEQFAQRFQREAKILAGIKHPNIVACHMAGTTDDGQSYLVMEFIDGPSLKKWITDHGAISVPASVRLMRATGQALGHAFALGIIHRDVKPENILLETVTSTALDVAFPFTPKVVDLGLARASSGNAALGLTSPGSVMGTPATMSPEQYDDPDSVDFRTDIYGLGCVFYEMLVGKPAYRSKKLTEIIAQKRAPQAPDPCAENPKIPPAVGALVQSMLATNREDRPASYKELDERLNELLDALGNRSRVNKTQMQSKPPISEPVVGEETVWSGPMRRPTMPPADPAPDASLDATMPAKPSGASKAPTGKPPVSRPPSPTAKPFQPAANAPSGPGLLRTSELNFLAEGMDQGAAAQAEPAFQEGPAGAGSTKPPSPVTAPPSPGPTPAAKKSSAVPLIAAVVVIGGGVGAWFAFGPGGGTKPQDTNQQASGNGGGTNSTNDKPVIPSPNKAPVIASIDGESAHALRKDFWLEAKASDGDNEALKYEWTVPDEVKLVSGRDQARARFRIEDGLPDARFEIGVEVGDGKDKVKSTKTVAVASAPEDRPLVGFEAKPEFKADERDGRWVDARFFISCRASDRLRTMTTSLGSEQWWEWSGSLVSEVDEGTPPAKVGMRFEFGKRAWVVRCTRASGSDDAEWQIEAMEATLDGGDWKEGPISGLASQKWPQPDEDTRGYFCVQRRRNELVLEIGKVVVPRDSQRGEGTEVETPTVLGRATMQLSEGVDEPQLTLFVDQGRGEFRVRRR